MATVTTTISQIADGSSPVILQNTGSSVARIRWEGHEEYLAPSDPPLTIDPQGRIITALTNSDSTTVTVTATTLGGGLAGTDSVALDDPGPTVTEHLNTTYAPLVGSYNPRIDVAFIGDSITANGGTVSSPSAAANRAFTQKCWPLLGGAYSGGVFDVGLISATTGYTTAQILSTHVPVVLAMTPKPKFCVVLGSANDATFAAATTGLQAIYAALMAGAIEPICVTNPPRNDAPTDTIRLQINEWIREYARVTGLQVIDMHPALVEPSTGNWLAGYNADNVHPAGKGSREMGKVLATAMQRRFQPRAGILADQTSDPNNLLAPTNSVMLVDTNADGVPDGWTLTGTGATASLGTATGVVGKACTFTRGSADAHLDCTGGTVLVAGRKYRLSFLLKCTVEAFAGSIIYWTLNNVTGANSFMSMVGTGIDYDIASFVEMTSEFTAVSVASMTPRLQVFANNTAGATATVAQVTLKDVTGLGLI
jgi:lysophospholipase L1-like esterase